jgi:hypothetical protein
VQQLRNFYVCLTCSTALLWLSDDTEGSEAASTEHGQQVLSKRRSEASAQPGDRSRGPNQRQRKERQPNWDGPEVMALIHAKQKEHEALQQTGDSHDHMETAIVKWTRVANDVAAAGFSVHFRGSTGCKDKWQVLFSDYKKISDYKSGTGHNEEYFRMPSKRRKELNLPSNFCPSHYKEMERFLHQRPSVNPPHQRDNFAEDDHVFDTEEEAGQHGGQSDVPVADADDDDFQMDPILRHSPASLAPHGMGSSRLPPKPTKPVSTTALRGKERLDNAARNMNPDPRPVNTAVKRR